MHQTALNNCKLFFETYAKSFLKKEDLKIIEIGSQDVNGSLRNLAPPEFEYTGIDFVKGKGVDIVLDSPYEIPYKDNTIDIVLSSSCFEHSEMFWLTFLEILRVLKPHGLFYLNVPSNGLFHRYPVDCWRFYPDSGRALISWAKKNKINAAMLESYISNQLKNQSLEPWNDFVGIFLKDESYISEYKERILDKFQYFTNGLKFGSDEFIKQTKFSEDLLKLKAINNIVSNKMNMG